MREATSLLVFFAWVVLAVTFLVDRQFPSTLYNGALDLITDVSEAWHQGLDQ